jgi:hypothetical protein
MLFQTRIRELTIGDAKDRRLCFRVGINIGDIIAEPHDIFGDGVNVAARLESIAEPGGICISSSAYEQVRGKVGVEFSDLGERTLKNIARPVRAYALIWDGLGQAISGETFNPSSAPRLSIVVLPFANIGGDLEQEYFVNGVTESLTTDLSRIGGSFVIARNSAFSYKGRAVDLSATAESRISTDVGDRPLPFPAEPPDAIDALPIPRHHCVGERGLRRLNCWRDA